MSTKIDAAKKTTAAGVTIRTKKKIVAAVVLALAALIGSSYWVGKSTEKTFRENMEEIARHGGKVTITDYRRGFFGATARTDWVLVGPEEESITLSFNHSIRHGPLLTLPATANIRSELMPSESLTALLVDTLGGNPFGSKTPLTIKSTFGWSGAHHAQITLPKFEIPALSWGGLNGEITVNADRSILKVKVVMPGLSMIENNENQLQIGRITFQTNMRRAKGYEFVFTGTSHLVLNKFLLLMTENTGVTHGFAFENARAEASSTLKNVALNMQIRVSADSVAVGGKSETTIDKPKATFLYENIDPRALETILRVAQNQNEEELLLALAAQAEALLQRKPVLSIKDVSASGPEGATTGNFRIAYTGDGNLDQFSLADVVVNLQFSLPIAPINRLLEEQASQGYTEKTKEYVSMINAMINSGFLTEKDGILSANASLENSALSLNGQPKSLEVLQELLELF